MRKIILIIFLVSTIFFSGCLENDDYTAERAFWKANFAANKIISATNKKTQEVDFNKAVGLFQNFIKEYKDSNLVPQAHFAIAKLYVVKDDFVKARAYYADMREIYKDAPEILADIVFSIGNTFELEGYWNKAFAQYHRVMKEFTVTKRSLELPFHIIRYYKDKKDILALENFYPMAIAHYQDIIKENPSEELIYACKGLIAYVHLEQEKWEEALNYLRTITGERYKDYLGQDEYLFTIALVYNERLQDAKNALPYLERLKKDYPRSKFANAAKDLIRQIND